MKGVENFVVENLHLGSICMMTTLERKIADQKKLIESLYDDLESREKFIEMLQVDMKDTSRKMLNQKRNLMLKRMFLKTNLKRK